MLSGCYSELPSNCARQLWDFAFGEAAIYGNLYTPPHLFANLLLTLFADFHSNSPLHEPYTTPLVDQVMQFVTYAAKYLPKAKKNTVTFWWIGINDTGESSRNSTVRCFAPKSLP